VVPVSTLEEIKDLPNGTTFDAVLLCHTLHEKDRRGVREIVNQRWPAAKMLSMTTADESSSKEGAEATVRGLDGPAVLLRRMNTLLHPVL